MYYMAKLYVQEYLKGSKLQPGPEYSKVGLLLFLLGWNSDGWAGIA
jgi:hypothetical protein